MTAVAVSSIVIAIVAIGAEIAVVTAATGDTPTVKTEATGIAEIETGAGIATGVGIVISGISGTASLVEIGLSGSSAWNAPTVHRSPMSALKALRRRFGANARRQLFRITSSPNSCGALYAVRGARQQLRPRRAVRLLRRPS
jgi:hypothetical protein